MDLYMLINFVQRIESFINQNMSRNPGSGSMLRATLIGATSEKSVDGNIYYGPSCSSGMQNRVNYLPTYNAGMNFQHPYNIPNSNVAFGGQNFSNYYHPIQPDLLGMSSMSTAIGEVKAESTRPAFGNENENRHGVWRKTSSFPFEIKNQPRRENLVAAVKDIRDIRGRRMPIRVVSDHRRSQRERQAPYAIKKERTNRGANACEFVALQTGKADVKIEVIDLEKLEERSGVCGVERTVDRGANDYDYTEVEIDVVGISDEEL